MINDGELVGEKGSEFYQGQNLYYAPSFFQAEYRLAQRLVRWFPFIAKGN
jgi:hypothetical protein